jgi:L-ascorbate metabolism protein UlaG (beta-lactamase superfamily)
MQIGSVELKWLGHSGFMIRNSRVIYIDPYNIREGMEKADFIFITHSHYDHCSVADMNKIVKEGTKVIMTADCQSKINKFQVPVSMEIVSPGEELSFGNLKVDVFPAYNTDKSFHAKDEEWVGYLIKLDGIIVYHAGDTDNISEMQKLTGYGGNGKTFVALLPIGGRFTMTAEEAAEAAKMIKPTIAVPMHYGSVVGNDEDAQEFKKLCEEIGIKVEILEKC